MLIFRVGAEIFSVDRETHRETDRQTVMTVLIVAFHDIVKAPIIWRHYNSMRKTHPLKEI
jgi:hypothetical protein